MNRWSTAKRIASVSTLALLVSAIFASDAVVASAQPVCGDWNLVPTPPQPGADALSGGVAALGADEAWAVGDQFVIRWDGSAWSEVALPDTSGLGTGLSLRAVGAAPPQHVWVAGLMAISPFTGWPLVMRWDGSAWDVVETVELRPQQAFPFAPRNGSPRAVHAVNPNDVWAVGVASGFGTGVGGPPPLTIHWDGSAWSEIDAPAVGSRINDLYGVAGVTSNDVWAVGTWRDVAGADNAHHALILHWDGNAWSRVPSPAEAIQQTFLRDVVAIGPNDVWVAGEMPGGALFMHWDGSTWTIAPSPVAVTTQISKLAAIASDDIWAVASFDPWYYHWDGVAWSQITKPDIPGGTSIARSSGMAVVGECDVWSVGGYFLGQTNVGLAERLQAGTPAAQCNDGLDNDLDGFVDYPADPGCLDFTSSNEAPQCQDGVNNDPQEDVLVDFDGGASLNGGVPISTPDPQCTVAWRDRERSGYCGLGAELAVLLPLVMMLRRRVRRAPRETAA